MAAKGETWNESETYKDAWTLRPVRRLTTMGATNQTPTYHTNVGFTADGEFLIFATEREGRSAICKVHVPTGDITQLTESLSQRDNEGRIVDGSRLGIAPRSRWALYIHQSALMAVHLDTLEERTIIPSQGPGIMLGIPSVSCDEQLVAVPAFTQHPEIAAGRRVTGDYMQHFPDGRGVRLQLLEAPLAGGDCRVIYEEEGVRSAHCPHSPVDPDLLLIDRDFPPRYWSGSDGKTNRIWTLRVSTGQLTELPCQDPNFFQVHSCWTFDGQHILYHGRSAHGGYFIGVCDPQGNTVREYGMHRADHYGHVSAMVDRPAIILDGNVSDNLLVWLYYDAGMPRIEVIAAHNTEWGRPPGQFSHPHPLCDPTGTWISFNAAEKGRTDIFAVKV
jgi:hypothetical protein